MNTRSKGRKHELAAKAILEAEGWHVQLAPNPSKWSLQNDLWGLWDLACVKADGILFIQVKSNHPMYGKQLIPYYEWKCPTICRKEQWVFIDRVKEPKRLPLDKPVEI